MNRLLFPAAALVAFAMSLAAAPPAIVVDDDRAAAANRVQLQTVADRFNLPTGKIAVDAAPVFQRSNEGLFLAGYGTWLSNVAGDNNWVSGRALAIRPGGVDGTACLSFYEPPQSRPKEMPSGQVGWLFNGDGSDGLGFYPDRVYRFTAGQKVPDSKLSFMRAFHGVPFTGNWALRVPVDHGLRVGDDVFATDGPYINECMTEWRRVVATGAPDAIVLNERLYSTYTQGTLVAGPLPRRMTFQGVRFTGAWGPVLVQQACDVKFVDCTFDQTRGWVSAVGCGRLVFANCTMPAGFQSSTSHDVRFRNCTIREVQGEQAAYGFQFDGCRFGPSPVDSKVGCTGWTIKDCVATGALFIYDGWTVTDTIAYGQVVVRGRGAVVRELWSAQPVVVQATYQGQPAGAGTGVTLDRVVAPSIHVEAGTSGVIRGRTCPVTGFTAGWTITPKQ